MNVTPAKLPRKAFALAAPSIAKPARRARGERASERASPAVPRKPGSGEPAQKPPRRLILGTELFCSRGRLAKSSLSPARRPARQGEPQGRGCRARPCPSPRHHPSHAGVNLLTSVSTTEPPKGVTFVRPVFARYQ